MSVLKVGKPDYKRWIYTMDVCVDNLDGDLVTACEEIRTYLKVLQAMHEPAPTRRCLIDKEKLVYVYVNHNNNEYEFMYLGPDKLLVDPSTVYAGYPPFHNKDPWEHASSWRCAEHDLLRTRRPAWDDVKYSSISLVED